MFKRIVFILVIVAAIGGGAYYTYTRRSAALKWDQTLRIPNTLSVYP